MDFGLFASTMERMIIPAICQKDEDSVTEDRLFCLVSGLHPDGLLYLLTLGPTRDPQGSARVVKAWVSESRVHS